LLTLVEMLELLSLKQCSTEVCITTTRAALQVIFESATIRVGNGLLWKHPASNNECVLCLIKFTAAIQCCEFFRKRNIFGNITLYAKTVETSRVTAGK
jgi:hypothetical protein